jgi:LDH2 family malate/lactate/ureidoglycolate dehydrogenase
MAETEVLVSGDALKEFVRTVFVRMGFSAADAEVGADVIVWANLRGVDSHGVGRIAWLMQLADAGQLKPDAPLTIVTETPAVLLVDAEGALGAVAASFAMRRAIAKARAVGIGWALVRKTTSPLAIGYYTALAAQEGLAGLAIVCNPPNMAPYGARSVGVHNSPLSIAVPAHRHAPLVLDMATSVAAGGKIDMAVDRGVPIPTGWALTRAGQPTTDPRQAVILLPAGGAKGSGLAMLFECLTSVMAGNPLVAQALREPGVARPHQQNGIMAAIDIALFGPLEEYTTQVDSLIDGVKALPRVDGVAEIMVPGEPEARTYAQRSQHGIPLPAGTLAKMRRAAQRYGVALPPGVAQ